MVLHRRCQASRCRARAVRTGVSLDLESVRVASLAARSLRARVVARAAAGSVPDPPQASRGKVGSQGRAGRVAVEAAGRVAVAGVVPVVAVPVVVAVVAVVAVVPAVPVVPVVLDGWLDEPLEAPRSGPEACAAGVSANRAPRSRL